jgi:tryptophan 2,3-dioxygenase
MLLDIDENMRTWRYKHALMVHRMLGKKCKTCCANNCVMKWRRLVLKYV